MPKRKLLAVGLLASFLPPLELHGETRYVQENGVEYREVRRIERKPMTKVEYEERERTVYKEEVTHDVRETARSVYVPVTEYRWEAEWRNRWNPFGEPYLVQRLVPRTHWEAREELVQTPVVQRRLIPEKRLEKVAVIRPYIVEEQVVVSRQQVSPGTGNALPMVAERTAIGGVSRLESDPPRVGESPWRPSTVIRR